MFDTFKIPFALQKEQVVAATEAEKGTDYTCPDCRGVLRLRSGPKRRAHFYHLRPSGTCAFSVGGEGAYHRMAKYALLHRLQTTLAGARTPTWKGAVKCPACDELTEVTVQLPEFDEVLLERRAQRSQRRPDVVLRRNGTDVAYLEALSTHAVGERKAEELVLPWLEIRATSLIDHDHLIITDGSLDVLTDFSACRNSACGLLTQNWREPPEAPETKLSRAGVTAKPRHSLAWRKLFDYQEHIEFLLTNQWPASAVERKRKAVEAADKGDWETVEQLHQEAGGEWFLNHP